MINEHLSDGKSSVNVTEVGGDGKEAYCTTDGWSFCFAFQTILFHCNIKKKYRLYVAQNCVFDGEDYLKNISACPP